MASATRPWAAWRNARLGTLLFGALLLSMTALSITSAVRVRSMREQRHNTVDAAIREYASLAARLFTDRAFGLFEGGRQRILSSIYGARLRPGESLPNFQRFREDAGREMDLIGFAVADTNRGFFRLDLATNALDASGSAQRPEIAPRIRQAVAEYPTTGPRRLEPLVWQMVDLPEQLSMGYMALRGASGDVRAYYGFAYSRRRGWTDIGSAVLRELPLLPTSILVGRGTTPSDTNVLSSTVGSNSDTLLAIQLLDGAGTLLFESRKPFAGGLSGEFWYPVGPRAFRAVATLHPNLVSALRDRLDADYRAGAEIPLSTGRRLSLPIDMLLPIVAMLLAITAGVGLWRERHLTKARRDFVASVSHELRTPLAQIRMFTETLQLKRERDEEERTRWLGIVGREARRLGDMVENILLYSHIDARRATLELERTDLGELIEEIVEGYVPLANERGMRVVADAPSRIFALVDPRAMRQVIVNLLDNALKYGPREQTVQINLDRVEDRVHIVVIDEGKGIRVADRKRIWEPFVRLGDRGSAGGSGIGLAVVRDLIELHGGTVAVDDAPGGGARFSIELSASDSVEGLPPRATGEFRAREMAAKARAQRSLAPATQHKKNS